jgi:hypothetical protein
MSRKMPNQPIVTIRALANVIDKLHPVQASGESPSPEKAVSRLNVSGSAVDHIWSKEVNIFKVRHIADVARQVGQQVLIEFVKKPELLNENNLLKLELGI